MRYDLVQDGVIEQRVYSLWTVVEYGHLQKACLIVHSTLNSVFRTCSRQYAHWIATEGMDILSQDRVQCFLVSFLGMANPAKTLGCAIYAFAYLHMGPFLPYDLVGEECLPKGDKLGRVGEAKAISMYVVQ